MEVIRRLSECQDKGISAALLTVVGTDKSAPREVGAKMLVLEDGTTEGTIGGGTLEAQAIRAAIEALKAGLPRKEVFTLEPDSLGMLCGGKVEVFIDVFVQKQRLVILGAGHVAERLAQVSSAAGIPFVVADDRSQYATKERFPDARQVVVGRPQDLLKDLVKSPEDYVAIVTRCHAFDIECLAEALKTPAGYIGVIGSLNKTRQVFEILNKRGIHAEVDKRVHAPIGLDLGDKSPGGIAISIIAEILKVKNQTSGLSMRLSQDGRSKVDQEKTHA